MNTQKILYITANPKDETHSYCLSVGRAFLESYRSERPEDEIIELDLYKTHVPTLDTDVFSGWGKLQQGQAFDELSAEEKDKVARINQLTDQFVSADKYVFVTPLWNFSFPPIVKAYIDTFCIAGKTFKYTPLGPVGLLHHKQALHIQARGGVYSEGPAAELEFGDRYLRTVLNFVGVSDVQSVIVEGMAQQPDQAQAIKERAVRRAQEAARSWASRTIGASF